MTNTPEEHLDAIGVDLPDHGAAAVAAITRLGEVAYDAALAVGGWLAAAWDDLVKRLRVAQRHVERYGPALVLDAAVTDARREYRRALAIDLDAPHLRRLSTLRLEAALTHDPEHWWGRAIDYLESSDPRRWVFPRSPEQAAEYATAILEGLADRARWSA